MNVAPVVSQPRDPEEVCNVAELLFPNLHPCSEIKPSSQSFRDRHQCLGQHWPGTEHLELGSAVTAEGPSVSLFPLLR